MKAIGTTALALFALRISAAEIPKAPVPPSPYLPIIYKFADAMLERGRDTNGLFYSALDRTTMALLTNRPPAPTGVREQDRVGRKDGPLIGSKPHHDQNLLRLLYTLSELSGKPKYRDAADTELRWFIKNQYAPHLSNRPWMLWERCSTLLPEQHQRWAMPPLHHISADLPREVGFHIRAWGADYQRSTNELSLEAIDRLVDVSYPLVPWSLSLAIDCDGVSRLVPDPLASKLRGLADEQDRMFCSLAHELKQTGGFIFGDPEATGADRRTPPWLARNGGRTTAQVAMMCVSRYENTGKVAYRDLIHAAADVYLKSTPPLDADVWPMTVGHAISLQVAAWRSTAKPAYLNRAGELADFALRHFFDQGPLPRASLKSNHYEAITGADTLALSLVELHLHILGITAVRYPPNTIDR